MVLTSKDLLAYASVKNCSRDICLMPETRTVEQKVRDLRSFICIKDSPCKIVEIRTLPDRAKRQFVAIDIFTGTMFKATFPVSGTCLVPIVTLTEYQLVDIYGKDSNVILLDEKDNMKEDLKLPTDQDLLSQIKSGFAEGKDVFVYVASAMGKEQIVASKILNPKL
ncbi:eukaryotic translation initiation factor 5A-4-like [Apium graveolens]|uniref:eukaryotic translation initiation factor 5A-4-like n=1 Tax=Apium graveolens TaxID=4045 RepID=UPI003D7AED82